MRRAPEGSRRWLPLALATLLAAAAGGAAGAERPDIDYRRRLQLPTEGDRLEQPRAVFADPETGEIFVCDSRRHRVLIFDADGYFLFEIRGGLQFRAPVDVAVDPDGILLVVAHHRGRRSLLQLDFDGRPMGEVVLSELPAGSAEPEPTSVAVSPAGDRLFVLDQANQRLWLAERSGRVVADVDLVEGRTEKEAQEQILGHVDVYGDTVLVAVPTAGSIRLYDLDGRARGRVGVWGGAPCQTNFPVAAAVDPEGRVLVVDRRRMLIMAWRVEGNACLGEYSGFGNAPGALYMPLDMTVDREGRIYVSQGFEGRVQVFEPGGSGPAPGTAGPPTSLD